MNLKPISCCSGAIRLEKQRSCWSDFTKRELPFALNLEVLLLSLGRRLSSILMWTQRELAKLLRFTAIFLEMDRRIITHLSFLSIATSNQSMKPTAHCDTISACLPRHPAVAYLCLIGRHEGEVSLSGPARRLRQLQQIATP